METARIDSLESYLAYKKANAETAEKNWLKEKKIAETKNKKAFTIRGFSYPAEQMVDFVVDYLYSNGEDINWRERVICPMTGLNNRLRGCIHFIDFELGLRPYHEIYIAEQVTPLYSFLRKKFPQIIGSEFLGEDKLPGYINENQIRHESATNLSFSDESLDAYLTFECLEHIPDFRKAFAEAARVLRPGGKFMWTVPFVAGEYDNIIRAYIAETGEIHYILEPEYHGDPVSEKGILCFTHFGWEMFDQVKGAGFRTAYALLYRSDIFGYLGSEQFLFVAVK